MTTLGERVRGLRENFGFSVQETAELAGLPAMRLEEIENDAPTTTRELAALGDALAVDPALLRSDAALEPSRSVARFRSAAGTERLTPRDVRLLARAAELGRICGNLLRFLGERSSKIGAAHEIRAVAPVPEPWRQGYELGQTARLALAPTGKPLESLREPMDSRQAFWRPKTGSLAGRRRRQARSSPIWRRPGG